MEKKLNKIEEVEINEEAQVEELTEETLDEVDGGSWLLYAAAFLAGAYLGDQINKAINK